MNAFSDRVAGRSDRRPRTRPPVARRTGRGVQDGREEIHEEGRGIHEEARREAPRLALSFPRSRSRPFFSLAAFFFHCRRSLFILLFFFFSVSSVPCSLSYPSFSHLSSALSPLHEL